MMIRVNNHSRATRLILFFVIYLLCTFMARNQQLFPPEHHKITVRLKLLDVIITDKNGNFVPGLTARDFEVYEDGRPRPVQSVELVALKTRKELSGMNLVSEPQREARLRKKIWVVFDCLNTEVALIRKAASSLKDVLLQLAVEGYELSLLKFDYDQGPVVLSAFTTDQAAILKSLERIEGSFQATFLRHSQTGEWKKSPEKLDDTQFELSPDELDRLQWRNLLQKSLSCLITTLQAINDYPGRKIILLISSGFPERESNPYFDSTGLRNLRFFDPFKIIRADDYSEIIGEIINLANSGQISIYCYNPEDTAGLRSNFALSHLSAETGGRLIAAEPRSADFLISIKNETEQYYEIAYLPASKEEDGNFHRVEVLVRREGLKVRTRSGYIEYSAEENKKRQLAASFFSPEFYKDVDFDLELTTWPERKNIYTIWGKLKLSLASLQSEKLTGGKVDFLLGVQEIRGEKAHLGQEKLDLSEDLKAKKTSFIYYFITSKIKIKPGRYEVVATLRTEDRKLGAKRVWLQLPDLRQKKDNQIINVITGLLAPKDNRGKAFTFDGRGLLNLSSAVFIPWSANEISPAARLAVFIQAFNSGKMDLSPEFFLDGKNGKFPLPARLLEKEMNQQTGCESMVYVCNAASIPEGEYQLLVTGISPITTTNIKLRIKK